MSTDQARQLVQRVRDDPEFRARLEAAPSDQKRAVLESEGFGDVKLRHLSESLPESQGGELSDEEFAAVAGGGVTTDLTAGGSAASGVTIVVAAAALF